MLHTRGICLYLIFLFTPSILAHSSHLIPRFELSQRGLIIPKLPVPAEIEGFGGAESGAAEGGETATFGVVGSEGSEPIAGVGSSGTKPGSGKPHASDIADGAGSITQLLGPSTTDGEYSLILLHPVML